MKPRRLAALSLLAVLSLALAAVLAWAAGGAGWTLLGWNDLGMHCMDASYRTFAILPPYNTIHAQLVDDRGRLVEDPAARGITVTYEAVADPSGSINTTSSGKTDFWDHVEELFGAAPPVDEGLKGYRMPGPNNDPQPMDWDPDSRWFTAEAIPLTPRDDAGRTNSYPMMRLTARDAAGEVLATLDIVLPVSDEMDCSSCHASGTSAAARPAAGWQWAADRERDYRLNILRLHDDRHLGEPLYRDALAANGYDPDGLWPTVTRRGRAVLCANCHPSNALPGYGYEGVPPFTNVVHSLHADVTDPVTGLRLGDATNRSACYRCHPGSTTRCLRGAMGAAVAADGSLAMQCQDCHGSMARVGTPGREGWFDEPTCQSCHTGTATRNNGRIRYTSVFDADGSVRQAVDDTFATNPDTPKPGFSLFRFSRGHGGLQCEACHGSTHAIFPSSHENDNIASRQLQGHAGVVSACRTCHGNDPDTVTGGPHGLHPVGQVWVDRHPDVVEDQGSSGCRDCHGVDYRGTVLSLSKSDQVLDTKFGQKHFWKGFRITCWSCHDGPDDDDRNPNRPAVARDASASTPWETPVDVPLEASDADGDPLELRIVDRPAHGRVALAGAVATYVPDEGFTGTDSFTWAAFDGDTDSNLATVTVDVGRPDAPPPVPDGHDVEGKELLAEKFTGGDLRLTWDVAACPAPGYHVTWFDPATIADYTVVGGTCGLEPTGDAVITPPGGAVAFVLVPDDGATLEGSHGRDSAGAERPSTEAACGFADKNPDGACQ